MRLEFWNLNKKLEKIKGNQKDQGEWNEKQWKQCDGLSKFWDKKIYMVSGLSQLQDE